MERPLTDLPGVGAATAERAAALGLDTVGGLLEHLPARYEAYEGARPLADLADGEEATVRGCALDLACGPRAAGGCASCRPGWRDESGTFQAMWFNQDYLARTLAPGRHPARCGGGSRPARRGGWWSRRTRCWVARARRA